MGEGLWMKSRQSSRVFAAAWQWKVRDGGMAGTRWGKDTSNDADDRNYAWEMLGCLGEGCVAVGCATWIVMLISAVAVFAAVHR